MMGSLKIDKKMIQSYYITRDIIIICVFKILTIRV